MSSKELRSVVMLSFSKVFRPSGILKELVTNISSGTKGHKE